MNFNRSNMIRYTVFGLMGITMITLNNKSIGAAPILNEQPMAGITLYLDRYYGNMEQRNVPDFTKDEIKVPEAENSPERSRMAATNDIQSNPAPAAEDNQVSNDKEKEKKIEEKIVLNLNYDRLGIAKVDNYLNIREKPEEDAKIIGKLPKDAGCHIYEIDENGWARIKSGKVSGYVMSTFMVTDEEAEAYALEVGTEMATVNTQTLNVRFIPSTESSIYTLIPADEELEVVQENLTESFVKKFIEENFEGEETSLISNVDQKTMLNNLNDWMCVSIDNEKVFISKEFVDVSYQLKKAVFVEELEEDGSSGVSSTRAQMVQFAKQYLGKPYVYGGTSLTGGIDCSGFMMRIYEQFGYSLPRTSGAQAQFSRSINSSDLKPGDLIFYGNGSSVGHVAMYIGNGQVIHASNPKSGIKISTAFYRSPMKIGRIIND